jgi:hypothetical protein
LIKDLTGKKIRMEIKWYALGMEPSIMGYRLASINAFKF